MNSIYRKAEALIRKHLSGQHHGEFDFEEALWRILAEDFDGESHPAHAVLDFYFQLWKIALSEEAMKILRENPPSAQALPNDLKEDHDTNRNQIICSAKPILLRNSTFFFDRTSLPL